MSELNVTVAAVEPLRLSRLDQAFAQMLNAEQPSADPSHALLAALTSHQFAQGHACLDLEGLEQLGSVLIGHDAATIALEPATLKAAAPSLPWKAGPHSPLILDGQRLYLRRNWRAEQSIAAAIAQRLAVVHPAPAGLATRLAQLFPEGSGPDGTAVLLNWQKVACALAVRRSMMLITGGPGTGKTSTVVRLLALLHSEAASKGGTLRIALAAPTGKAAARLGASIAQALLQLPVDLRIAAPAAPVTLHKLLDIRPDRPGSPVPELADDVVLVDEASMIDLEMMARLLAATPPGATLVLLGDKDQLASVEAGGVMGQLCAGASAGNYDAATIAWVRETAGADVSAYAGAGGALALQTVMLRDSWRFGAHSGIGRWARAVNEGDVAAVAALWAGAADWERGLASGSASEVTRMAPAQAHDERIADRARAGWAPWLQALLAWPAGPRGDAEALALLAAFAGFQVLCAVRQGPWGVVELNRRIGAGLGFVDGVGEALWYAGRPVMVTRNNYELKLMNGDVGLCLARPEGLRVVFPDGEGGVRWVAPSRLDAVESVFAMTVHKSQGSEFEQVMVVLPDRSVPVLTREFLYTAISRARSGLTLLVPAPELLWHAVRQRVLRSGGLVDLLDKPQKPE